MRKKYLRSDFTAEEFHFIFEGGGIRDSCNYLTRLFMMIGVHEQLCQENRECEILDYNPENDFRFLYENRGYSIIGRKLNHGLCFTDPNYISRKYIKNVSRKWIGEQVVLSFETDRIITCLLSYISERPLLHTACMNKVFNNAAKWEDLFPIQKNFLNTRSRNEHKDYQKARTIINSLPLLIK